MISLESKSYREKSIFQYWRKRPPTPPPVTAVGAGRKIADKIFHAHWGPINIPRQVTCFFHENPTGLHMLPDYISNPKITQ